MLETLLDLMAKLPAGTAELAGTWIAALLTLAVLSYVFGNNPAFRLAQYLFVGVAAGYAAAIAWNHALWPRLQLLIDNPTTYWYYGVFFILGLLLLLRGFRPLSVLGNLPLGVLFGTGAALALGGALTGSLVPQMRASIVPIVPIEQSEGWSRWAYAIDTLILVFGTIAVLSAFHFTAKGRGTLGSLGHGLLGILGGVGRKFIMIAFGALLAGALLSFFSVLRSRLDFLIYDWITLLGNMGL